MGGLWYCFTPRWVRSSRSPVSRGHAWPGSLLWWWSGSFSLLLPTLLLLLLWDSTPNPPLGMILWPYYDHIIIIWSSPYYHISIIIWSSFMIFIDIRDGFWRIIWFTMGIILITWAHCIHYPSSRCSQMRRCGGTNVYKCHTCNLKGKDIFALFPPALFAFAQHAPASGQGSCMFL